MAQNNEEQKKLITEIMELDAKDGLYERETAVEWLFDKLKSHFEHDGDLLEGVIMAVEIAKQMEKEQLMDAVSYGDRRGRITTYLTDEQYYNNTYGKQ